MKSTQTMTLVMVILFITSIASQGVPQERTIPVKSEEQLICSPELQSLANTLVHQFSHQQQANPFLVTPMSKEEISVDFKEGSIALLNKDCLAGISEDRYFEIVVGRDALVPIMNSGHPLMEVILANGISAYDFASIYTSQTGITWGEILGQADANPVHAYLPAESSANYYLADFMHTELLDLNGTVINEPSEMVKLIEKDPFAIGFCRLASLKNIENSGVYPAISLVPVDMDGNSQISTFEDIYASTSTLSHAIYLGRYPKALYSRIYAITSASPAADEQKDFIKWLLDDGQKFLAEADILALGYGERSSRLTRLSDQDMTLASVPLRSPAARIFLITAGFFLVLGSLFVLLTRISGKSKQGIAVSAFNSDASTVFPGGLFFDRSHTWAFMEKSGCVRIGIDDFLQNVTGPLTRVVVKQPGEEIKRGEHFLTLIQNGKRLKIQSPVSGVITEQNEELIKDASLTNRDPYHAGWVLLVEPVHWISGLKSYFIGQSYADWIMHETARLKAFFTGSIKYSNTEQPALVMQDGGEITAGVLERFGPEMWEEFQEGFIDKAK